MKIVIELNREDLLAAIKAGEAVTAVVAPAKEDEKPAKKSKKKAEPEPEVEEDEDEEDEDEEDEKPAKKPKKKAEPEPAKKSKKKAEPEVEEDEDDDEADDEEADDEEEEEEEDDTDYVSGEDLKKLTTALNAHKAANGGKVKKTLEILKKFAPGGSNKVKPEVLPKLLKALKV